MDKPFKYYTAAESRKPGYLKRRFSAIRKQQKEEDERRKQARDKVRPIKEA